jgi:hypothetical protein
MMHLKAYASIVVELFWFKVGVLVGVVDEEAPAADRRPNAALGQLRTLEMLLLQVCQEYSFIF